MLVAFYALLISVETSFNANHSLQIPETRSYGFPAYLGRHHNPSFANLVI